MSRAQQGKCEGEGHKNQETGGSNGRKCGDRRMEFPIVLHPMTAVDSLGQSAVPPSRIRETGERDADLGRVRQDGVVQPGVPDYEFLQCTGDFKPVDGASRRLIRSHVMRNYFQEKRNQANILSSASSASTVNSKDKLKGRWRLDPPAEESKQPEEPPIQRRESTRRLDSAISRRESKTTRSAVSSRKKSRQETVHDVAELLNALPSYGKERVSGLDGLTPQSLALEQFQTSSWDPFNTLPVKMTRRVDRLLTFYAGQFNINSVAVNPTRTWYNYVMQDPGLFNGILSTVALYMHSHVGIPIVKEDILYHRGETMKIINKRLNDMKDVDAGLLIGVIATILSFENLCGNYFTSKAHLQALRRLIDFVGGMEQFNYNDSLGRGVVWAEFHYAAAQRLAPPYRYTPATPVSFPEDLLLCAAKSAPTQLINVPIYGISLYNIFRRIHRLGLSSSMPWNPFVERVAISNLLLETEYDMLALSAQLGPRRTDGLTHSLEETADLVAITDALCTCGQFFAFVALRSMPIRARIVEIYLERLQVSLARPDLQPNWAKYSSLEALLWTLFIAATAATGRPERQLVIAELRTVTAELGVRDQGAMLFILKAFAWADFFQEYLVIICVEVFRRWSEPCQPVGLG